MTSFATLSGWRPEQQVPEAVLSLVALPLPADHALAFYQLVRLLKTQPRTGWINMGIKPCELILDHMYRMGIILMSVASAKADLSRCVKIALVHDIAELLVGDIVPMDVKVDKHEKHQRELAAINYLCHVVKPYNEAFATELSELWWDYEEIRSPEARLVKDVDKFEMLVQAVEYERDTHGDVDLSEFFSARAQIKTEAVGELADRLMQQRKAMWAEWGVVPEGARE